MVEGTADQAGTAPGDMLNPDSRQAHGCSRQCQGFSDELYTPQTSAGTANNDSQAVIGQPLSLFVRPSAHHSRTEVRFTAGENANTGRYLASLRAKWLVFGTGVHHSSPDPTGPSTAHQSAVQGPAKNSTSTVFLSSLHRILTACMPRHSLEC